MDRRILINALRDARFFRGVATHYLEDLADIAHLDEFEEGDVVFREGESVENVYVVTNGEVALEVSASGIDPQHVYTVASGESLGWSALFDRSKRTATAVATAPTSVFRFGGEELLELCDANPNLGYAIMRQTAIALSQRLQKMRARFIEVYRLQPTGFMCGPEEVGVD
jgi:CRP/FNR family cyclic AMP-dependent transcriptional regulator